MSCTWFDKKRRVQRSTGLLEMTGWMVWLQLGPRLLKGPQSKAYRGPYSVIDRKGIRTRLPAICLVDLDLDS